MREKSFDRLVEFNLLNEGQACPRTNSRDLLSVLQTRKAEKVLSFIFMVEKLQVRTIFVDDIDLASQFYGTSLRVTSHFPWSDTNQIVTSVHAFCFLGNP